MRLREVNNLLMVREKAMEAYLADPRRSQRDKFIALENADFVYRHKSVEMEKKYPDCEFFRRKVREPFGVDGEWAISICAGKVQVGLDRPSF